MPPTEAEVIEFIRTHPGCKSKDIAKHFNCASSDINRRRAGYRGIYSMSEIEHPTQFTHKIREGVSPPPYEPRSISPVSTTSSSSSRTDELESLREQIANLTMLVTNLVQNRPATPPFLQPDPTPTPTSDIPTPPPVPRANLRLPIRPRNS